MGELLYAAAVIGGTQLFAVGVIVAVGYIVLF